MASDRAPAELLFDGHYRGPETWLGSYTFLKLYPGERWLFAESDDPQYDFPTRIAALAIDVMAGPGHCLDGTTRLVWGGYTRGTNVAARNSNGQVVGRLADALESTTPTESGSRFQIEIVGPGQLRPTTHEVLLTFIPERPRRSSAPTI